LTAHAHLQTLLAKHKLHPAIPFPGAFPYTTSIPDPPNPLIRHLTFSRPSPTGEFTDYTARYGALQEEDRSTLLDFYLSMSSSPSVEQIELVAEKLRITHLLDVPLIGLSSGQTRRSRLAASLLTGARMVLLEDPFAGLDVGSRKDIAELLGKVNSAGESGTEEQGRMRTVLVLRGTGLVGMPEWIDKVAKVTGSDVWTGSKEEYIDRAKSHNSKVYASAEVYDKSKSVGKETVGHQERKEPLIYMEDVNVAYGAKKVRSAVPLGHSHHQN